MADTNTPPLNADPVTHDAKAPQANGGAPPSAVSPPSAMPQTRKQVLLLLGLVILKRLRFLAIVVAVGVFIGYWDTVMNYWDRWTEPRTAAVHELEPGQEFYCPMDPQVHRSSYEPNGDIPNCPICGMPLSIRQKGQAVDMPEGVTGRVQLSPERIALAGIKTAEVGFQPVEKETKTVGFVTFDESQQSRIVSRVEGYVEKLYVNETYTFVHKGDPLAEIYSPELYSTAREFVLARKSGGLGDLAAAARNKLLLLGVSEPEIDGLAAAGQPSPRLVIRSPQEGYVIEKKIVAGASVEAKMTLFEVADLSTVWIEAEVYEKDIPFLQVGQQVEATVDAYPHRAFAGTLARIYPRLEAATRTNRIRLRLDNPQNELRPGMFASVRIRTPLERIEPFKSAAAQHGRMILAGQNGSDAPPRGEFLTVPERAVVDTGEKTIVYVEREPGVFEGREVILGPRQDEFYPVLKGLRLGDKVAAAGGFLIDAETRLNPAAAATYFGASGGPQSSGSPSARSAPNALPHRAATPSSDTPAPSPLHDTRAPATNQETRSAAAGPDAAALKNLEQLPEADRKLALAQRVCPVTGAALGSMGVPIKIALRGQTVFLCCKGCVGKAQRNPDEILQKLGRIPAAAER